MFLDNILEETSSHCNAILVCRRRKWLRESQLRATGNQKILFRLSCCEKISLCNGFLNIRLAISIYHNMSSDLPRMFQSSMLVADEMAAPHPDQAAALNRGLRNYSGWLFRRALTKGKFDDFPSSLRS
jgi:hypothetical protein